MERAVDAEADEAVGALGLDVDVAGALLEGVLEEVIDGVDHVLVAGLDLLLALHADELLEVADVDAGVEHLLGALHRAAEAVKIGDDAVDVALGGDHQGDLAGGGLLDRLEGQGVGGVAGGVGDDAGLFAQGQEPVLAVEGLGEHPDGEGGVELEGV